MIQSKKRDGTEWYSRAGAQELVLREARRKGHALVCMRETEPHPDSDFQNNILSWASYAIIDDFLKAFGRMPPYFRSLYEILPTYRAMPLIFDCEWLVPLPG